MPRVRPIHLRRVIRSPRNTAAMGTVQRLVVHTITDDRPAGTSRSAVKTRTNTLARRKMASEAIMGRSRRGGTRMFPLMAPMVMTTRAAPTTRKTAIQMGVIDLRPVAMIGQLKPRRRTTVASRR